MPMYEYHCEDCGQDFEQLAATMDAPAPDCPHCGKTSVQRKLSVFGVGSQRPERPPACGGCCSGGACPMNQ